MPEASLNISSIATLPPAERAKLLAQLTEDECQALLHDWGFLARPEQLSPDGEWENWLILAGRGFGKTRTGAEWVRDRIKAGAMRVHLIAPTAADARDIMVEGESGLLAVCWSGDRAHNGEPIGRPEYEPSKRRLTWENGAVATMFSAEEPDRLRGPQAEALWADELAAWKYMRDTWDMAQFGLRLGSRPQACITTTPKPLKLLRELAADPRTIITRGSTFDNAENLAPTFLNAVRAKYEGTRLGRQELYAELLDEAEGALWTRGQVERCRKPAPDMRRIVVAVDPAVSDNEGSAEVGIVAAGIGVDGRGYILKDHSKRCSPGEWSRRAVSLYENLKADRIVAEGNQGGNLVSHAIHTVKSNVPVKIVHASRGKQARAEPVAALYEQGKISHAEPFPELEDQMVTWEPLGGLPSPDRLDAMVWAVTELMLDGSNYDATMGWV